MFVLPGSCVEVSSGDRMADQRWRSAMTESVWHAVEAIRATASRPALCEALDGGGINVPTRGCCSASCRLPVRDFGGDDGPTAECQG